MSTLTGQQIKDTYDGLLKLQDSTAGITGNLQPIQDGLGNNTGSRISTNYFTAPNVVSVDGNIIPDYMGNGVSSAAAAPISATGFNKILYTLFYDSGMHSYSAITYDLHTLTSTSDVVSFYFYSLQFVPTIGIAPKDLIMSGITLQSTGSTGIKTTALPSTLSFSGTGGGFYIYAIYVANAGVAPTVRYRGPSFLSAGQQANAYMQNLGFVLNSAGTAIVPASRVVLTSPAVGAQLNLPAQTSYSQADIITNQLSTQIVGMAGFGLNVIK